MRFSNNYHWDFFALIAGVLFTLSFAPFNFAYLAPLALMVLFASWQNVTAWRALLRGYLFGLGSFGFGVSWVYISIHDFGGAGVLSAGAITALFVAFWSLFPAFTAFLAVKMDAGKKLLMAPIIWILVEYFRGVLLLNGFPWLLGAYSQLATPLSGYVPLVGAYGTGFLLVLSASAGVMILQRRNLRLPLGALLGVVWLAGGLLKTVVWTDAVGDPIRVSMIQGNISQDQKWRPENRLNTLLLYKKLTEEHWDSDVVIWPETAIPAYLSEVEEFFLTPLNLAAQQHGTDLIVSLPIAGSAEDEIYNGVITLGSERGIYRKNHLLPFGEYMPWQPVSGFILKQLKIKLGDFTPGGNRQPLLKAAGYPFITSICYEDAFGDAGIAGLPDAAYLVNVTNDGWFGNSLEPHQHLQIAAMRALETGRFMLRSTNTGATAVIAPNGKIIRQAPLFETRVLTEPITPMGGMTPYARWGDKPIIVVLAVMLLGLLAWNRRVVNDKRWCPES
ncbi:MAG: apolipoprotein N-acyltransferase [Methylovulum sp.]|nr:apolipoprotein N-acyltransferase [Methylovulum sp.]